MVEGVVRIDDDIRVEEGLDGTCRMGHTVYWDGGSKSNQFYGERTINELDGYAIFSGANRKILCAIARGETELFQKTHALAMEQAKKISNKFGGVIQDGSKLGRSTD